MALPGSELYKTSIERGYQLPESYEGFSFHSKETLPIPTNSLTPAEILKFRDEAFLKYHTSSKFLNKIEQNFGTDARNTIEEMTKIKLERNLLKQFNF
jgi:hypothetical protein